MPCVLLNEHNYTLNPVIYMKNNTRYVSFDHSYCKSNAVEEPSICSDDHLSTNLSDHNYFKPKPFVNKTGYVDLQSEAVKETSICSDDHLSTNLSDHNYFKPKPLVNSKTCYVDLQNGNTTPSPVPKSKQQSDTSTCVETDISELPAKTSNSNESFESCKELTDKTEKKFDFKSYKGEYRFEIIDGTKYVNLDVPGDGNCFFHSVSLALHGNFSKTEYYRRLVCSHIIENWDIWGDLASISHDLRVNTASQYWNQMIKTNGWATVTELKVTCELLNLNIMTCLKGRRYDRTESAFKTHFTKELYQSSQMNDNTRSVQLLLSNDHFTVLTDFATVQSSARSETQQLCANNDNTKQNNKRKIQNKNSGKLVQHSKSKQQKMSCCNSNTKKEVITETTANVTHKANASNTIIQNSTNSKQRVYDHAHDLSCIDLGLFQKCRKLGLQFECPSQNETKNESSLRQKRNARHVQKAEKHLLVNVKELPNPPPLSNDNNYNNILDCIRGFELEQMSYKFSHCHTCHERRLQMKMASENTCQRCSADKNNIKMFSVANLMDPKPLPIELQDLTLVEQQLICRIAPVMQIHMLKHGGIAANGHCVTFPQNVNEPAQILPQLPEDIKIIRVRKIGTNDTSKEFNVRRSYVQKALTWLKINNEAYSDITISQERLHQLPENAPLDVNTVETKPYAENSTTDDGPAPNQSDPGEVENYTVSSTSLQDESIQIREKVEQVAKEVVGPSHGKVTQGRKYICIPWPTRNNTPLSEFTTKHFFTLAFPCLFPYGIGDYHINRPRTCVSMSDWAEHLMWYEDGRFAQHMYFKFIVHNIIMRKRTLEQSNYIVKQQLGEEQLSISDLKKKIQNGDTSIAKKILYFGATLRGTSQYWAQKNRELRSLIQFQINQGKGLPSVFATGSCAEYHFKALRRLLHLYTQQTSNHFVDLNNRNTLFSVLQKNTHIVSHYFDLRTQSYFNKVMTPGFDVSAYWYRQEFAKSRGMIHWHGLCWRSDREPHNLIHEAIQRGLAEDATAEELAKWAHSNFAMTASHPAGTDMNGLPRKNLWPPPEGTAPAPPEEKNPLLKLLMDVSETQETLLEDHLLLCNRINIHRCSDYCLRQQHGKLTCRMEFGTEKNPGKCLRKSPAITTDKNGSLRLEMPRDHPLLVQHSQFHTQGWRANGDISLILSKSSPDNPSVNEIIATEKYISGYACKGNQPTGAVVDLFNDMANAADESSGASTKSVCTKLLMNTVKRDISSMEASYELLSLPLYRCSHLFQSVSFTGSRVLERSGTTFTKSTPLDKYLARHPEDTSSWYQYLCNQGKVPVINGSYIRATWPLQEEYCRSIILLHTPNWRCFDDFKNKNKTWEDLMHDFFTSPHCPNFVKADIERAKRHECEDHFEESDTETEQDTETESPEWAQLLQPHAQFEDPSSAFTFDDGGPEYNWAITSRDYPQGYGMKWLETIQEDKTYIKHSSFSNSDLRCMNKEQKFAFNLVMTRLFQYHENSSSVQPLRLIVSGTAGSGKSFLIKCLVHAIRLFFSNDQAVQVLCPTGNSANLISGKTIHSFLQVPTNTSASKEMSSPDGQKGEIIQENCKQLLALLVDERSLVGSRTLGWMEFICRHGKNNSSSSWGGIPVIVFFGDDIQLPPVCDTPVYSTTSKSPAGMHGSLVWKEFNHAVELKTIIRQNNDQQELKQVLLSLREYKTTKKQTTWLQQFQWDNLKTKYGNSHMSDLTQNGLFVFPSHDAESNHNCIQLMKMNSNAPVAKIAALNKGPHAKSAASDKASGLLNLLYLCQGAKVMLTCNLCVPFGLFNGSVGVVKDIIYLDGRRPQDSLPDVIMVSFQKFTGKPFLPDEPTVVPITPVERMIECPCHGCKRLQVPLRLGWGTTIHRCQGMTIGAGESSRYIVIDPGTPSFESKTPGALFVALSRAKSAGNDKEPPDLAWHPNVLVNEDRICHVVNTPTTVARKKEIQRIMNLARETKHIFAALDTQKAFNEILTKFQHLSISMEE